MRYVLKTIGNWNEQKAKLKIKFKNLIDSDLEFEEGKHEEMMNSLHVKLAKTRQEMIRILNNLKKN